MYFAAAAPAKRLLLGTSKPNNDEEEPLSPTLKGLAKLGGAKEESIVAVEADADGELVAVLTQSELSIWSAKPSVLVCRHQRDALSLRSSGQNLSVQWRDPADLQDEHRHAALVVQTKQSHLLHYSLLYTPQPYWVPDKGTSGPKVDFPPGSGEGTPIPGLSLKTDSYLDLHQEGLSAWCATDEFCLVVAKEPLQLVCIPWSAFYTNLERVKTAPDAPKRGTFHGASVTRFSDIDWLIDKTSPIVKITFSLDLQLFVFITADGRAYNVRDVSKTSTLNGPVGSGGASATGTPSSKRPPGFHLRWRGSCMYGAPARPVLEHRVSSTSSSPVKERRNSQQIPEGPPSRPSSPAPPVALSATLKATSAAMNARLSLVAIGLADGSVRVFNMSNVNLRSMLSHNLSLRYALKSSASSLECGPVTCLAWTSDGYALAVGWANGFSLWSPYGRLTCWSLNGCVDIGDLESASPTLDPSIQDRFVAGTTDMCWIQGDFDLWMLCPPPEETAKKAVDEQLFVMPFAKSAVAGLHSPDNAQNAFMQLEDRVLVYRGADQPDMSIINPESDVWQSIKLPAQYLAQNWPVRMACVSADTRLIAVAGRFGFAHFNSLSGRWKMFDRETEEMAFVVRGGMQWFGPFLIVAIETVVSQQYKVQVFSRDKPLNTYNALHEETFQAPVVMLSIFDSSLLVYTADNTLTHFLISTSLNGKASLRLCGSIGFEGVIRDPQRVRGISWLVPRAQHKFGDPADDLNVATMIFLIDGKLVLLRPRRAGQDEVKYDLQVLADKIEFYWTHLSGIGTLENSLWGWDGKTIRVWLNALTIEASAVQHVPSLNSSESLSAVKESVAIPLEFYPLSVLMDKGIIVGATQELSIRKSLGFLLARNITSSHLFLHHILRFHLTHGQTQEAVLFASFYQHLVYFAHGLEILLHSVLEEEADELLALQKSSAPPSATSKPSSPAATMVNGYQGYSRPQTPVTPRPVPSPAAAVLPRVVEFLDHFEESLEVVAGCARKTEISRWEHLFDTVGRPRDLFESCLSRDLLQVAASFLLVLHNLEPLEQSIKDTVKLFKAAMTTEQWTLAKELLRFLYSLDNTGNSFRGALIEAQALPERFATVMKVETPRPSSAPPSQRSTDAIEEADEDDHESHQRPPLASPPEHLRRASTAIGRGPLGLGLAGGIWSKAAAFENRAASSGVGQAPRSSPMSRDVS